jgi:hypothetical protein
MSIKQKLMSSEFPKLLDFVMVMSSQDGFEMGSVIDFIEEDGRIKVEIMEPSNCTIFEAFVEDIKIVTRHFNCEFGYH